MAFYPCQKLLTLEKATDQAVLASIRTKIKPQDCPALLFYGYGNRFSFGFNSLRLPHSGLAEQD